MRCLLLVFALLAARPGPAAPPEFQFHIGPSTADVVLKHIAEVSDTQILFPVNKLKSTQTNGIFGRYSLVRALELALTGTGFEAQVLEVGAIVVSAVPSSVDSGPIEPTGKNEALRAADADLSGSYATDHIVVIGSILRRPETSAHLVTRIDLEEMRLRGTTNALEILSTVLQNQSIDRSTNTAAVGGLSNLANLRALGSENTLVLSSGRRVAKSPLRNNGVDLNTIPMALIDSVDVLTDGASSVYGSDAVAGVINFRTLTEFEGLRYRFHGLEPSKTGGGRYAGGVSWGAGSLDRDGWNVIVGASWRKQRQIQSKDRDFSKTSDLSASHGIEEILKQSFPANVSQFDENGTVIVNNANPYPECDPPISVPSRGGCGLDADAAGFIELQNPEQQRSIAARVGGKIEENEVFLDYFLADSTIQSGLAPTTFDGIEVPPISPYFPGRGLTPAISGLDPTLPVVVSSRWTPGGRRITENHTYTDRLLGTIDGHFAGVSYEAWALGSTSVTELTTIDGAFLRDAFIDGFAGTNGTPFLNPFGEQSAAGEAYLTSIKIDDIVARGEGELSMIGITLNADLLQWRSGTVSAALAAEYGEESAVYDRSELVDSGIGVVVGGGDSTSGSRDRYSVTAELLLPLTHDFEVDVSIRGDRYSDFGTTVNPKILASLDVTENLNVHASLNTGFRAPTLYNLYTPNKLGFIFGVLYDDPVLCPRGLPDTSAGGVDIRDCSQLYNVLIGGNPDLGPEESTAFSLGIELGDDGDWELTLDYWQYRVDDRIGPLSHAAILSEPQRFKDFITRCSEAEPALAATSVTCSFGAGGDPIAYIVQREVNLGRTETAGVDIAGTWSAETSLGTVEARYRGTYVSKYKFERVPGDLPFSRKGRYFDGFPVFDYSHYLDATWRRNAWYMQLQHEYTSGYEDCNEQCGIAPEFHNYVDPYSVWSLSGSYRFRDWLVATVHVRNIFDHDPPFTNGTSLCTGCDLRWTDPAGRAVGLTISGSM